MANLTETVLGAIKTLTTDDAADYVDSIMSSQQVFRVCTPVNTGKKRNRSAPSPALAKSTIKRSRNSQTEDTPSPIQQQQGSVQGNTRRTLYREAPTPAPRRSLDVNSADVNADASLEKLISTLSTDVRTMFSELNHRIDKLEEGLEQRISTKVAHILDKRVNSEMKRIRKDVDTHIENVTDAIKSDVAADIADLNDKITSISAASSTSGPDLSCNIVVRNLPETTNENTKDKVNMLIREGCGVNNVSVVSAEPKKGPQGKPGIVVAKFKSVADKKAIMMSKRKLRNSRRHGAVYIQHDQTKSDRVIADNFRAILSALKSGNRNISLRGNRVVHGGNTGNSDRNGDKFSQRPRHQDPQAGGSRTNHSADTTASDRNWPNRDSFRQRRR